LISFWAMPAAAAAGPLRKRLKKKRKPTVEGKAKAVAVPELTPGGNGPAGAVKKKKATKAAKATPSPSLPFECEEGDHAETPLRAYADLVPFLDFVCAKLGKPRAKLRVYDPYYCQGGVAGHLASLGFTSVHNQPDDFFAVQAAGAVPEHDVLITNPAYSGDHIPRLLQFAVSNRRPWMLLLPFWVCRKDFYTSCIAKRNLPFFLCPKKRYFYLNGRAREGQQAKVTAPFDSFWYVSVRHVMGMGQPDQQLHDAALRMWQSSHGAVVRAGTVMERSELRLAHSFLKRRGDPGYHTALDRHGGLVGRIDSRPDA
jgi:hypothetical protein